MIKNWLRSRTTPEFLGTWESMYNPDLKVVEFDHFESEAGLHTFTLSAKEMKLLLTSKSVSKALRIATAAHKGQTDKAGVDYIQHPIAVAETFDTEEEQTTALLHDVIEDTPLTLEDLKREGFSDNVLQAVWCLTHKPTDSREAYLQQVAADPLAVKVKLADLAHNSDISRLTDPTENDFARVARYKRERAFLEQVQNAHHQL